MTKFIIKQLIDNLEEGQICRLERELVEELWPSKRGHDTTSPAGQLMTFFVRLFGGEPESAVTTEELLQADFGETHTWRILSIPEMYQFERRPLTEEID